MSTKNLAWLPTAKVREQAIKSYGKQAVAAFEKEWLQKFPEVLKSAANLPYV